MKTFKVLLPEGTESRTDEYFIDHANVAWPIYVKRLAIAAMANAGSQDIAHGVADIKLNGHFNCRALNVSNAGNTARVSLQDIRLTSVVLKDVTNITIANTADLSLYVNGHVVIEYCKTSDNA